MQEYPNLYSRVHYRLSYVPPPLQFKRTDVMFLKANYKEAWLINNACAQLTDLEILKGNNYSTHPSSHEYVILDMNDDVTSGQI